MSPFLARDIDSERLDEVRVALYARQSHRRADTSEASPDAQLAAGRALVDSRSQAKWCVVAEFKDVGKSGWDPKIIRPDFEDMMSAVERGELDVIVINELSRLTRQGAYEAMKIDQHLRKYGVRLVSVQEPFLDTSNPVGEAIFALIAALAKQDSDIKAARTSGSKEEIRAVGGHHSADPPYGMRTRRTKVGKLVVSTLEPDPEHAAVVRRLAELALAGHSYNQIAKQMNEERVPTPGLRNGRATQARLDSYRNRAGEGRAKVGVIWRAQTVRGILTHPAVGGFASVREPRGPKGTLCNVLARDETGKPLTPHDGILTGTEWLQVQEAVGTRKLKPGSRPVRAVPQLLSGWKFARCGYCDNALGQSGKNYLCANPVGHGGLGVRIAHADDYVARRVWAKLAACDKDDPQARAWIIAAVNRFAARRDRSDVEEERAETCAHLKHVQMSIEQHHSEREARAYQSGRGSAAWHDTMNRYLDWEETCRARLAELEAQSRDSAQVPSEWFEPGTDPLGEGSSWAAWDIFQRREFLGLFLEGVRFTRGRGEDNKIVPIEDRTDLLWRPVPGRDDAQTPACATVRDQEGSRKPSSV